MKSSNKTSIITGTILLLLAAFFSISLILQILDFGINDPGHNNFLYLLGNMLFTVYGFSSIFIPIFLLYAGLSSFATTWTSQKTMHLITAIIPFFTAVVTEKICRSILALDSNSSLIKMIIALVTGAMLIVIEILGASVMAESINQKIFYKNKPRPTPKREDSELSNDSLSAKPQDSDSNSFKFETIKKSTAFDKALSQVTVKTEVPTTMTPIPEIPEEVSPVTANIQNVVPENTIPAVPINPSETSQIATPETPVTPITPVVEAENETEKEAQIETPIETPAASVENQIVQSETSEASETSEKSEEIESITEESFDESFQDLVALADDIYEEDIPSIDDYADIDNVKQNSAETKTEENDEAESANPGSIITQEEYAALINPADFEEPEPEVDELEWPDLPPAPQTLPPEYLEDFDENDPALDFPPKDEVKSQKSDFSTAHKIDNNQESAQNPYEENTIDLTRFSKDNSPQFSQQQTLQQKSAQQQSVLTEAEPQKLENNVSEKVPYYAKHLDDSLHPNPAYPAGITLRENSTPKTATIPTRKTSTVPKYPTKISLDENDDISVPEIEIPKINYENEKPVSSGSVKVFQSSNPVDADDDFENYVVDETLPEPPIETLQDPFLIDEFELEESIAEYESELAESQEDTFQENSFQEEFTVSNITQSQKEEEEPDEKTLDPDFFDIDMNAQEDDEELSEDIEEIPEELTTTSEIFNQISQQEKGKSSFSSAVSSVFADMDADIQKNKPVKNTILKEPETIQLNTHTNPQNNLSDYANNQADFNSETNSESSESIESIDESVPPTPALFKPTNESKELDPNANSAKNLTADELSDFFNAQQEENTPKTRQIEGNLPTNHRATQKGPYVIPSDLLTAYKGDQYWVIDDQTKEASLNLKQTLAEFNIDADIIGIKKGPVVTMFELLPAPGVKLSKIVALQDNIALSLAASSVRIVAPIPGKQAVGIEVPNKERSIVSFRELIEMELPEYNKMTVPVVLGKDILGKAQLIDLVKTPHMLIAGATGSGKSVCVNSLILSILYKRSYKDVKLILVDPKVVELKLYNNIPHLLTPVITEPKRALQALQYCLCEMERRYALLDNLGVRDISSYNQKIKDRDICTEKLPYIVVIIDEFADLMATSGKELESIVARLTAMSRAVGIHLVLATQRPSVNVITGLIKANIPSRIAFMVASRTDSNIIIDSVGAEKLLGRGDMLYASAVDPYPVRIQGTFVSDSEVENVVNYVKQFGEPDYIDEEIFVEDDDSNDNVDLFGNAMGEDPLYNQALEIVFQAGKASASYIQRRLKIGYNRAARLVEEMEERGIVGPANGSKPREIIHMP